MWCGYKFIPLLHQKNCNQQIQQPCTERSGNTSRKELADIKAAGLYKNERVICSPQRAEIDVAGKKVLNFCANNYLGLSDNPRLIEAAKRAMDSRGFGMSSVRFICGCQDIHKELEKAISDYFGTEDTILYAACFDANGGVFEPLLTEQGRHHLGMLLNHASIIDGVRLWQGGTLPLCQRRHVGAGGLPEACAGSAFPHNRYGRSLSRWTATPPRWTISALWPTSMTRWLWFDECHSAGVLGKTGRGITELYDLRGKVDILTGTLGKGLRRRRGRLHGRAMPRSSTCCASVRVPTSSRTRCRPQW